MTQKAGFTLVELILALFVTSIGLTATASVLVNLWHLADDQRDDVTINFASRSVIEDLRDRPLTLVIADHGFGTGPSTFWCQPDGSIVFTDPGDAIASGTIEAFNVETAIPSTFADMGGGFDLNADGLVTSVPVIDATVLPVRIVLVVAQPSGTRTVTQDYVLGKEAS